MRMFDTHAHVGLIHDDPIEQLIVVQEARQDNIDGILSICNNLRDFFVVYENLKTAPNVYFAVGVSPSEVTNPGRDWEEQIEQGAAMPRVVAIGETGLDYFRKFGDKNSQIELFIRQLEIADRLRLPVIIHNREAGGDTLEILREKLPSKGGVLHCYSEDWAFAQQALELNLYISFAGNVTYRNARTLHETALNMPLDRMLVESESPFMVPAQHRGKRNKPSYMGETVRFLAELREMPEDEMADILFQNACRLFNIEP
ncbi:TatD family hydrolase [Spirochaeta africana]|uniref:Hydrolase, TatD family n=1 Tax=Spirochaeta africana (strain ATCC 700263 / DSM 8902 / Z-7692) TaxID=889378 RepID=H9UKG0_SPIAZ|nr:TatD family hydrolase [Spirochaeta africana]AFG38003.1 hydrolase, TatD family [Spirochaeta africana DSM 8902]